MKKKLFFAIIFIASAVLTYTGCSKDDDGPQVISIFVSPVDTVLSHNKATIQYTCVINYSSGQSTDGTDHVVWNSSDKNTATISNNAGSKGLATTVGSGVTLITASLEGVSGPASLEVLGERAKAMNEYVVNYLGSEVTNLGWTGNTVGCIAGVIAAESNKKTIQRINYFRNMVGIPGAVTFNASQVNPTQECALIMHANMQLSHYPTASWDCYTDSGAYAAAGSNIALSSGVMHSTIAVVGYIEDPGANNTPVGHRAWILLPELEAMGDGSTEKANCLMWKDNYGSSVPPGTPAFIAYPPGNYIPSTLVFDRWSFSIAEAGFGSATVVIKDETGNSVNLTIVHRASGYKPDNRIVWEPQGINLNSATDVTYTVTVAGITNAAQSDYTYDVIIFKPPSTKTAYQKMKEDKVEFEIR